MNHEMRHYVALLTAVALMLTGAAGFTFSQQNPPLEYSRVLPPAPNTGVDPAPPPANVGPGYERPTYLPDTSQPAASPAMIALNVDYTILRARRQSADFAIADPNTDATPEGSVQSLQPSASSGFRIGIALQSAGSPWALGFNYSYFRASDSLAIVAPAGGELFATLTRPGTITAVDTSNAATNWTYDLYDICLSRDVAVDQALSLRVSAGTRIANIGQGFNVQYDGRDANLAQVQTGFNFSGAGLMTGCDARWQLGRGFGLVGWLRGGVVYGANSSFFRQTNNNGATVDANITDRSPETVPVLEMGIGASWTYRRFSIQAGYEMSNWFQLVSTPEFTDDVATGKLSWRQSSLSLDGFFARISISF
jgi:hypothetical protein